MCMHCLFLINCGCLPFNGNNVMHIQAENELNNI